MAPTSKIVFPISIYASHFPKTHHLNPSLTGQLVTAIMPRETLELVHRFSALAGNKSTKTGGDVDDESKSQLLLLKKGLSDTDHAILLAAAVELVDPGLTRSLGVGSLWTLRARWAI
ncbi:hypothetical protein N7504_011899 [Penicillium tannophilum]|nr:hypothetical protein N7504_011899 [Penicillium tannophilum]